MEGRYALCVLFEYAATLGLIDFGCVGPCGARDDTTPCGSRPGSYPRLRYDGLAAVRVNEPGAAILHDPLTLPYLALPVPRRALQDLLGQRANRQPGRSVLGRGAQDE